MTYKDTLDAAWAAHLEPRTADAPTVVSTFAGCGGSSLGYSMAGYRELLAVEWDDHAAVTFRRNFPDVPLFHGDIAAYDPASLGLAPGELDVFDGSPPCQGFSTAGRRQVDDPRNQLFREYVRLLTYWQPRVLVMENVAGMVKGKMRLLFTEILHELKGAGYHVSAKLLNAALLGVPQSRPRLVFVGVRTDLALPPAHPQPVAPRRSVRDAFTDLEQTGVSRRLEPRVQILAPLLKPGVNGSKYLTSRGKKGNFHGVHRLRWNYPAQTIICYGALKGSILHPDKNRCITTGEMARLQSFPDSFDWGQSTYGQIGYRIGNSVPPLMMRAVAQTIRDRILEPAADLGRTA